MKRDVAPKGLVPRMSGSSTANPIASEEFMHRVRRDYEVLVDKMCPGFARALGEPDWTVAGVLHQTDSR